MGQQDQDLLASQILPAPASAAHTRTELLHGGGSQQLCGVLSSFGGFSAALGPAALSHPTVSGDVHSKVTPSPVTPRGQGIGQAQIMETLFLM